MARWLRQPAAATGRRVAAVPLATCCHLDSDPLRTFRDSGGIAPPQGPDALTPGGIAGWTRLSERRARRPDSRGETNSSPPVVVSGTTDHCTLEPLHQSGSPRSSPPIDVSVPCGIGKKALRRAASFAHAHRRPARSGATAINHHMSARHVS